MVYPLSRRTLIKSAVAIGAVGVGCPAYIRNARASSGELNLLMWADEFPDPVVRGFEEKTGIKVNKFPFAQNDEQLAKLQASGGEGFDLCQPPRNRAPEFEALQTLLPFDTNRVKNASALIPSILKGSTSLWTWSGELYHLPHCWGSEAISYRTDRYPGNQSDIGYGSLWTEDVRGHVQGRPQSLLLGVGLWQDGINGHGQNNRMLDGYLDEQNFRRVWDPILDFVLRNKNWIRQFWDSSEIANSGFLENEIWIGQVPDTPSLALKMAGQPVNFTSPKEGALVWVDGLAISKGARNLDQAYEFINYLMTPEVAAQIADGSGYNPVVMGAENHTSANFKKNFQDAYPGDALKNLWLWPPEENWYKELRSEYVDRLIAG